MAVIGSSTPIKRIQRGTVTVTKNSSATVSINSVDTGKSFVTCSNKNGWGTGGVNNTGIWMANAILSNAVLTNSTTVSFATGYNYQYHQQTGGNPIVSWEVIEYV